MSATTGRRCLIAGGLGTLAAVVGAVTASAMLPDQTEPWLDVLLCRTREPGSSPAERRRAQRRRWAQARAERAP